MAITWHTLYTAGGVTVEIIALDAMLAMKLKAIERRCTPRQLPRFSPTRADKPLPHNITVQRHAFNARHVNHFIENR